MTSLPVHCYIIYLKVFFSHKQVQVLGTVEVPEMLVTFSEVPLLEVPLVPVVMTLSLMVGGGTRLDNKSPIEATSSWHSNLYRMQTC